METLFRQIAPVLEKIGQSPGADIDAQSTTSDMPGVSAISSAANLLQFISAGHCGPRSTVPNGGQASTIASTSVEEEDTISEQFGHLTLGEHGGMRIGGSLASFLIQSFYTLTASPHGVSLTGPGEDPQASSPSVDRLYFPPSETFGSVRTIPNVEKVEYPDRDLTDKLVSAVELTCCHRLCTQPYYLRWRPTLHAFIS
jgi:hypothetical protein